MDGVYSGYGPALPLSEAVTATASDQMPAGAVEVALVLPLIIPQEAFSEVPKAPLASRKITAKDYRLVNELDGPPAGLKKLAAAIRYIGSGVMRAVNESVTARRLLLSGLLGGLVGLTCGVLAMAALSGGITMVTLLPSLSISAPAAMVGVLAGVTAGLVGLAGYGVVKGLVRSAAYLWRSPEQRFLHDYRQVDKALKSLEEESRKYPLPEKQHRRIGILRGYLEPRHDEYERLLKGTVVTQTQACQVNT